MWDAMQQQLAATGELHNNCRMTWGKAFLLWTASPQDALMVALHVNHKCAPSALPCWSDRCSASTAPPMQFAAAGHKASCHVVL
jgi:hypothetical protein